MKRLMLTAFFAGLILSACIVSPGPGGYGVEVAPALPAVVVLGPAPYYQQGGYFYYYHSDVWHYSHARNGPWTELPRSHWPRETRHEGRVYRHEGPR